MKINDEIKKTFNCRFCGKELKYLFVSLGSSPLSNAYLKKNQLKQEEVSYPLDVYVCDNCFLVQLPEFETPENIFSEYAYFSSYSETWLKHSEIYVDKMMDLLKISKDSYVVEIASNDGYLLQYFKGKGVPVLGIEPARNVAEVARKKGVPTECLFLGKKTALKLKEEGKQADLLLGNNVLAHVPDINDFVEGLKILLKPEGVITMEFPHLMRLIQGVQFDTIYHEHFSYFSFITVQKVFKAHSLEIFDVEEVSTHGGSLRIYAKNSRDDTKIVSERVLELDQRERELGFAEISQYLTFSDKVEMIKKKFIGFLSQAKKEGKIIVGYGAAAKGNTLLNYCGVTDSAILYVADKNPYKQGSYLPGSHIPVRSPSELKETKPDYVLILPWNIKDEIMDQMSFIRDWGGKFVVSIPEVLVI